MSWQGIVGQDHVVERFRRGLRQGRLASSFLFIGPDGVGKRTFAIRLAQALLCARVPEAELAPCGDCPACRQVLSDSHPDLQLVSRPDDRSFIPVELFIGDRQHRMRAGLCHFISLKPASGKRRIAVIDDADWLNQEGANCLLKTLEEPSPGAVMILLGTSEQRQLPTIRSRCQLVRFAPLSDQDVVHCLLEQRLVVSEAEATSAAAGAEGSLTAALNLADPAMLDFRRDLWHGLAHQRIDRGGLARLVNGFMDSAGKDVPAKRKQLQLAFQAAVAFYRAVVRQLSAAGAPVSEDLSAPVAELCRRDTIQVETAAALLDRCLDAQSQLHANANLGLLVDAWLCDLAVATRTGQGV